MSEVKQLAVDAVDLLLNCSVAVAPQQQRGAEMFLRLGQLPGLPGRREQGQHPSCWRQDEEGALPEEGLGESPSPSSVWF